MIRKMGNWLDHRTGYRSFKRAMLLEHIPGGAKWRYVWGSCLAFVFMLQVITGILLMTAYSPGDSTAWGSVYQIQYEMDFGWLIRGLHHFGSQTMVVLLALHMLQVVIAGAHLPPREINWWIGLMLMGMVLGLSLTGYLLPWDQKGYYATQVATNLFGEIPLIGDFVQKVLVGGSEYGHATLTRFFALHVGILPALTVILLIVHIVVFRRHGVTTPPGAEAKGEGWFWPDQAFRDLIMCLIIFGIMVGLVVFGGQGNTIENHPKAVDPNNSTLYERWAKAGREGMGANLDAPADRETQSYPARPEWYFLFLFQLLKYFPGDQMLLGSFIIPNGVMLGLFLLPLFGFGRMRKFGHFLGVVYVVAMIASVGLLTLLAMAADSADPWPMKLGGGSDDAKKFQHKVEVSEKEAHRAVELAAEGIPEEGARQLLRNDPKTKGPKLFAAHCATCHKFSGWNDAELNKLLDNPEGSYKASDLGNFATAEWIEGLLEDPSDPHYFGLTPLKGMAKWKKNVLESWKEAEAEDPVKAQKSIAEQKAKFKVIARWLADQKKPKLKRDMALAEEGRKLFFTKGGCSSCHRVDGKGGETAPNLSDYGSEEWLRLMIMSPANLLRHGGDNHMPAFRNFEGPGSEVLKLEFTETNPSVQIMQLSDIDREIIIRWLMRDYRVVFGGQEISGPRKREK